MAFPAAAVNTLLPLMLFLGQTLVLPDTPSLPVGSEKC